MADLLAIHAGAEEAGQLDVARRQIGMRFPQQTVEVGRNRVEQEGRDRVRSVLLREEVGDAAKQTVEFRLLQFIEALDDPLDPSTDLRKILRLLGKCKRLPLQLALEPSAFASLRLDLRKGDTLTVPLSDNSAPSCLSTSMDGRC